MPSIAALERALIGADKAGDTDAARKLAAVLKRAKAPGAIDPMGLGDLPAVEGAELSGREEVGQAILSPSTPQDAAPTLADYAEEVAMAPIGTAEAIAAVGSSVVGSLGGTLKGMAQEMIGGEFGTPSAAQRIQEESIQGAQDIAWVPRSESGKKQLEFAAKIAEPLSALGPPGGISSAVAQSARSVAPLAKATALTTKAAAIPKAQAAAATTKAAIQKATTLPKIKRNKSDVAKLLIDDVPDASIAEFKLAKPKNLLQKGEIPAVIKDKKAIEVIKQGVNKKRVASIKTANNVDREAMKKMVNIAERGIRNQEYLDSNRPGQIVGDIVSKKINSIRKTNKIVGREIEKESLKLVGKKVDTSSATAALVEDLKKLGVNLNDDMTPNFKGSSIAEGAGQAQIKRITRKIFKEGLDDAADVHRAKGYIDEQVNFGKDSMGKSQSSKAERVLKNLRSKLDSILDEKFPEYDKANTVFKETKEALDKFQSVAGSKIDFNSPSVSESISNLMRRITSNAQSKEPIKDAIKIIDKIYEKYGGKGKPEAKHNYAKLIAFRNTLEDMIPDQASTSLRGESAKAIKDAVRATTSRQGMGEAVMDLGGKAIDKARGINTEAALKAIRELLKEGKI